MAYRTTLTSLVITQAFSNTTASIIVLTSALTGVYLADNPAWSTLPIAFMFVGTMCAIIPAAMFMRRFGRRAGFSLGQFIGILAGASATYAILMNSFWGFVAACWALGVHNGFWQYLRFAAAEAVPEHMKSRAISWVMAGGVFSAIVAPELAKATRDLFAPVVFAGCYATISAICLLSLATLQAARIPPAPPPAPGKHSRPVKEIMAQPVFIVAALSAMIGYGTMSLVMTATPLAILDCGLTFNDAAFVIQWHVLAMFAPSFFTGQIIARFGVLKVIGAGILLNLAAMSINLSGLTVTHFWAGMVALGLGWNFMYIGGTTLLTEAYTPDEREKAQAANDFLVFTTITIASLSSGALQATLGWSAVNMVVALPVTFAGLAIIWFGMQRRSAAA